MFEGLHSKVDLPVLASGWPNFWRDGSRVEDEMNMEQSSDRPVNDSRHRPGCDTIKRGFRLALTDATWAGATDP